jgi:sigma-B regulation protein RsbU (phosphoserine phosphatase)
VTVQLYESGRFHRSFRGVKVSGWNEPAGGATHGGDWCEAFPISENAIAISVGDVCGHGVPAHEEMRLIRELIRQRFYVGADLWNVVAAANRVATEREQAVPVTAIVGLLLTYSNKLWIANAGHPPPLVQSSSGSRFWRHSPGDLPLGVCREHDVTVDETILEPDSLLVFYTDGIVESHRNLIEGERRLMRAVSRIYRFRYLHAAHAIAHEMNVLGSCLQDDAAVLTLRTR